MPSIISHAVVSTAAGRTRAPREAPLKFWVLSTVCSIIPDAGVVGLGLGVPYGHFFGHRGFFHSPVKYFGSGFPP